MTVSNLINKQGNAVKNQFIITKGDVTTFQSYNSKIIDVNKKENTIVFYPDYNFSVTTAKYRNKFLSDMLECDITNKDVEKMIKDKCFNGFYVNLISE